MTCGLIGIRRVLFRQRYRIRRPENAKSFTYPSRPTNKFRIFFPNFDRDCGRNGNTTSVFVRISSATTPDISNDRHREFLWGTVNRRIGIRFRYVLRAGRRDVDGRLLTNVSRVFADINRLPVSSPQLAADNRPVRPASPRRFRRGFREDLRRRSVPATCCTEYTANRLFRENKPRKRGKPSDSQIGREIPWKIARTRRRRRSTTSYGRYVGNSDLFSKANARVAFSQRFFA